MAQPVHGVPEHVRATARWPFMHVAALPQEYKHYKAEQEAKLKGEAAH